MGKTKYIGSLPRKLTDENGDPYNSNNRLPVDASVEINAIEIKDRTTDDKLKVNPDGSINANTSISVSVGFIQFNQLSVAVGNTVELLSYSPSSDSQLKQIIIIVFINVYKY